MRGRPAAGEHAAYYSQYIDRVAGDDVLSVLAEQARGVPAFLRAIGETASLHRYAEGKWSVREVVGHVNDAERVFQGRAWWFARAQKGPLSSFDPDSCARSARAHETPWAALVDEFEAVRASTLAFFRALDEEAWTRTGTASDNPFSVRALAYICAGHVAHHLEIVRDRYLGA